VDQFHAGIVSGNQALGANSTLNSASGRPPRTLSSSDPLATDANGVQKLSNAIAVSLFVRSECPTFFARSKNSSKRHPDGARSAISFRLELFAMINPLFEIPAVTITFRITTQRAIPGIIHFVVNFVAEVRARKIKKGILNPSLSRWGYSISAIRSSLGS
jgi:hypothetical protein